jgi:hypothetical protein
MPKRKNYQTPEWEAYWADNKAPHPDSFRLKTAPKPSGRVLAPFSGEAGATTLAGMDRRQSFYCHHYRAADEHYHKTMEELEACLR